MVGQGAHTVKKETPPKVNPENLEGRSAAACRPGSGGRCARIRRHCRSRAVGQHIDVSPKRSRLALEADPPGPFAPCLPRTPLGRLVRKWFPCCAFPPTPKDQFGRLGQDGWAGRLDEGAGGLAPEAQAQVLVSVVRQREVLDDRRVQEGEGEVVANTGEVAGL